MVITDVARVRRPVHPVPAREVVVVDVAERDEIPAGGVGVGHAEHVRARLVRVRILTEHHGHVGEAEEVVPGRERHGIGGPLQILRVLVVVDHAEPGVGGIDVVGEHRGAAVRLRAAALVEIDAAGDDVVTHGIGLPLPGRHALHHRFHGATVADVEHAIAGVDDIADRPAPGVAVVVDAVERPGGVPCVVRGVAAGNVSQIVLGVAGRLGAVVAIFQHGLVLHVGDLGGLQVAAHQFAGGRRVLVQRDPGTVALAVHGGVTGQVACLALADHVEDVLLGALRHADVHVAPAGDVDVVDHLRIAGPRRRPHRVAGGAVLHPVGHRVGVSELVQRLVAGGVQHRLALRVGKLGELLVQVLVALVDLVVVERDRCGGAVGQLGIAGVVPVDVAVVVVQTLDQQLAEFPALRRVRVVVADLRQRHVHRVVFAAGDHFAGIHLLGDHGRGPGDLRYLDLAVGHLAITGDHFHGLGHGHVHRHQHATRAGQRGVGIEHDVAAGLELDGAAGVHQPLTGDDDAAALQLAARDVAFQLIAAPGHIHAGVEIDAAVGGDVAVHDLQAGAGIHQHAPVLADVDGQRAGTGADVDHVACGMGAETAMGLDLRRQLRGDAGACVVRLRCIGEADVGDGHAVDHTGNHRRGAEVDAARGVDVVIVPVTDHGAADAGLHDAADLDARRRQVHQPVGLDDGIVVEQRQRRQAGAVGDVDDVAAGVRDVVDVLVDARGEVIGHVGQRGAGQRGIGEQIQAIVERDGQMIGTRGHGAGQRDAAVIAQGGTGRADHIGHLARLDRAAHRVAGDQQLVARLDEHVGIVTGGIHVAAGQHVDVGAGHDHVVARVDVAQHGDIATGGVQTDQTDLACAQRARGGIDLADHTLDLDRIGGGHGDAAARGGVQRAAGQIVAVAIQLQRIDQHADAAAVGAAGDGERIVGADQTADPHLRARQDGDVAAGVQRADRAAQLHVAIGTQADQAIADIAPGGGDTVLVIEHAAGIDLDGARGAHGEALAGGGGAGLDADGAGGQQVAANAAIAQHDVLRGADVDLRRAAAPGGRDVGAVDVVILAGADAAQHHQAVGTNLDLAVVGLGIELPAARELDQAAGFDFQRGIGFQHRAAAGAELGRERGGDVGHGVAGHGGVAERAAIDDQAVGGATDRTDRGQVDVAQHCGVGGAGGADHRLARIGGERQRGLQQSGADPQLLAAGAGGQAGTGVDQRGQLGGQCGARVAGHGGDGMTDAVHVQAVADAGNHAHVGQIDRGMGAVIGGNRFGDGRRTQIDRQFDGGHAGATADADQAAGTGDVVGARDVDRIAGGQPQFVAGVVHQQAGIVDVDVAARLDQHGAGQREVAVQADVAAGADRDLVVPGRRRGRVTADDAGQIDVLAGQFQQCAGLQPAGFAFDRQRALGRCDLQQGQVRIALTDGAVDHHVVQTGQDDAAACIQRGETAGAMGGQTDLVLHHAVGAGVDDDVALGGQVALDQQRVARIDDDVGVATQSAQVTLDHGMAGRVQHHAAGQRLQQAGGGQAHVLAATRAGAGIKIDGAVRANPAGNGDLATGCVGPADVDHRAARAGVDGIAARRGGGAGRGIAVGDLRQAQQLGVSTGNGGDAEGELAGQHQAAVVQPHLDAVGIVAGAGDGPRADLDTMLHQRELAVDGCLQVVAQRSETGIAERAGGADRDLFFQPGMRAQQDAQHEAGIGADVAIGELGEAIGGQLLRPSRGQHRQVAGGGQRDAAEFA